MNRKHTITNSDLVAYLDGVCDPRMAHRIEAALLDDKDLAARLAALDVPLLDMKIEFPQKVKCLECRSASIYALCVF